MYIAHKSLESTGVTAATNSRCNGLSESIKLVSLCLLGEYGQIGHSHLLE